MQYERDIDTIVSVAMKMKQRSVVVSDKGGDLSKTTELIAHSRFMLAMRLHALIFAAACNKPAVGIAYDVKVSNFIRENNTGTYLMPEELSEERIVSELERIAELDPDAVDNPLKSLSERAEQNIDMLISLVEETKGRE